MLSYLGIPNDEVTLLLVFLYNLQCLNNVHVFIIKTEILISQAGSALSQLDQSR